MLYSNYKACYEEDHLISLENGGDPRDPRNLWPKPYATQIDGLTVGARQKDTVENYIHNVICFNVPGHKSHGTAAHASLTLQRGQEILATLASSRSKRARTVSDFTQVTQMPSEW